MFNHSRNDRCMFFGITWWPIACYEIRRYLLIVCQLFVNSTHHQVFCPYALYDRYDFDFLLISYNSHALVRIERRLYYFSFFVKSLNGKIQPCFSENGQVTFLIDKVENLLSSILIPDRSAVECEDFQLLCLLVIFMIFLA